MDLVFVTWCFKILGATELERLVTHWQWSVIVTGDRPVNLPNYQPSHWQNPPWPSNKPSSSTVLFFTSSIRNCVLDTYVFRFMNTYIVRAACIQFLKVLTNQTPRELFLIFLNLIVKKILVFKKTQELNFLKDPTFLKSCDLQKPWYIENFCDAD